MSISGLSLKVQRVYMPPDSTDGTRVLVDRLWPRGLHKERARVDLWLKELAPSTALREWFGHDPDRWEAFRERYAAELDSRLDVVERLIELARKQPVTLLYAARDEIHNNAVALKAYLERGS